MCDLLPILLGLTLATLALLAGLNLRSYTFTTTAPVRYRGDIGNGLHQGARVLRNTNLPLEKGKLIPLPAVLTAWVHTYDSLYANEPLDQYSLDYTPLRLLVMTLWTRHVWFERGQTYAYDDSMTAPLMHFNSALMVLAALATFLLTRLWLRKSQLAARPPPTLRNSYLTRRSLLPDLLARHRSWFVGLIAAALVWFNAACLIDAHAFPQWDVWVLPFYLFACYFASRDNWFTAGVCLVLGAMLKGQVLLVAPVLVAWPILQLRPGATLRLLTGLSAGIALVTFPWLLRSGNALTWIILSLLAALILTFARTLSFRRARAPYPRLLAASVLTPTILFFWLALTYPALRSPAPLWTAILLTAAPLAITSLLLHPRRALPFVLTAILSVGTLLSAARYGGSLSWYEIGFKYPTEHYLHPAMGPTANLPAILNQRYRWNLRDPLTFAPGPDRRPPTPTPATKTPATPTLSPPAPRAPARPFFTLQSFLRTLYFLLIAPIALMLPHHAKRSSPKVLLCLAAPWVLMFAFVPQMHERYLVWGAAATATCIAVSTGYLFLHLATTAIAFACIATQILGTNALWWPLADRIIFPLTPDLGWAATLLALIYLIACLTPSPRPTTSNAIRPT